MLPEKFGIVYSVLYVGFVEVTFPMQDFGYDAFRAKNWDKVFLAEAVGFHQCAKDFDRRSIRNKMMLFFVCFNQGHQDFGILLFLAGWIVFAGQFVQDGQVLLMLTLGCDWHWRADFQRVFFGYGNHDSATPSRRTQRDPECIG